MTQLSGAAPRPSPFVPAVLGIIVLAGAIALGVVGVSLGDGASAVDQPAGGPVAVPATPSDRDAILGGIQSEYLARVAAGWYATAPGSGVTPGGPEATGAYEQANDAWTARMNGLAAGAGAYEQANDAWTARLNGLAAEISADR